jgi:hypothetical protein
LGLRVAVNSQDTAVVLGPSATSTVDPGPMLTWVPRTGSPTKKTFAGDVTPSVMALDGADAIWLAGQLWKPVTFGGSQVAADPSSYYLVKLNADGSNVFTKAVARTESNLLGITVYGIAFDGQGNAYVAGGLMIDSASLTSAVFVSKFSPAGALLMDRVFQDDDTQALAFDVAIAPNGDVVIAGMFDATLHVGSTTLTSLAGTSTNGFVAVLNAADLAPKNAFSFGGAEGYDVAYAVDVVSSGAVRVAGGMSAASTIAGTPVSAGASGTAFVAEVTATGNRADFVDLIGAQGIAFQTSTDAADRTFVAGRLDGATHDAFLAIVAPDGGLTMPWRHDTGAAANGATTVAADRHGGVWVGGELQGRVDLGMGAIGDTSDPTAFTNFLLHFEP